MCVIKMVLEIFDVKSVHVLCFGGMRNSRGVLTCSAKPSAARILSPTMHNPDLSIGLPGYILTWVMSMSGSEFYHGIMACQGAQKIGG